MSRQMAIDVLNGITPQALSTNTNGTAINLLNYIHPGGRNMKATVIVGAMTGTSPTLDIAIQENTTSGASGWTAITGATFTQITTSGQQSIHFVPVKQYIRAVFTAGGSSPSILTCFFFLGELKVK